MKKVKFSKKLIVLICIFLLIFISIMAYLFYKTGNEPATLITCVFAFCGIEGGILGWIKTSEEKLKSKKEEEESEN